jgi:hypothetical protein
MNMKIPIEIGVDCVEAKEDNVAKLRMQNALLRKAIKDVKRLMEHWPFDGTTAYKMLVDALKLPGL